MIDMNKPPIRLHEDDPLHFVLLQFPQFTFLVSLHLLKNKNHANPLPVASASPRDGGKKDVNMGVQS